MMEPNLIEKVLQIQNYNIYVGKSEKLTSRTWETQRVTFLASKRSIKNRMINECQRTEDIE